MGKKKWEDEEYEDDAEEKAYRSLNIADIAEGQFRMNAAVAALAWLDAKEYSVDALEAIVQAVTATDDDEEDDELSDRAYRETFNTVADFLILCGANPEAVKAMFIDPSNDRANRLAAHIIESPAFLERSHEDLLNFFVAGNNSHGAVEESFIKRVIDGKVEWKRKRTRKKRMSSAQKAALKKARKKSNTSSARRNRMKSMRIRANRNL